MSIIKKLVALGVSSLWLAGVLPAYAQAPVIDPADDAKHLGLPQEFLYWTREQQVAGYRNINKIFPTRKISASGTVLELPKQLTDLGDVQIEVEDRKLTADEYFLQQSVAGLLVIKNGTIVYERYGLGNTENSLWTSFSVAKSLTSLLFGAAVQDGYIKSLDEKVTDYLPRLKNSAYDKSSIRNLLQMSSGVEWNEDYADQNSDVNSASWDTLSLYEYLRNKPNVTEPGEVFNYNTAETNLAGTLLRSAIGNNLSTYLSDKIWKPFGMESDASWMLSEVGGGEFGGGNFNATLRDYGRLGLFALRNGQLSDGTKVLPESWMADSTAPSKGSAGYGYFWWLNDDGSYRGIGIFGQEIFIDPKENVVIALQSARANASRTSDWYLQLALMKALTQAVKN